MAALLFGLELLAHCNKAIMVSIQQAEHHIWKCLSWMHKSSKILCHCLQPQREKHLSHTGNGELLEVVQGLQVVINQIVSKFAEDKVQENGT